MVDDTLKLKLDLKKLNTHVQINIQNNLQYVQ